jgi:acetylornithine deacetylase/succinyl-diaminopimelate desuccinylase-like protein
MSCFSLLKFIPSGIKNYTIEFYKSIYRRNKNRFLDELFSLIRIPSISAEKEHRDDMYKAAKRWKELLLEAGADKAEVLETAGNPVTFAEKIIDASLPTI